MTGGPPEETTSGDAKRASGPETRGSTATLVVDTLVHASQARWAVAQESWVTKHATDAGMDEGDTKTELGAIAPLISNLERTSTEADLLLSLANEGLATRIRAASISHGEWARAACWAEQVFRLEWARAALEGSDTREFALSALRAMAENPATPVANLALVFGALASANGGEALVSVAAVSTHPLATRIAAGRVVQATLSGSVAPVGTWSDSLLRVLSGGAALRAVVQGVAMCLGLSSERTLLATSTSLSITTKRMLFGRVLRETAQSIPRGEVGSVVVDRDYARMPTIVGLLVFSLSLLIGTFLFADALTRVNAWLLALAALVLLGGAGFDIALFFAAARMRKRSSLEVHVRDRKNRLRGYGVAADRAAVDAFAEALKR